MCGIVGGIGCLDHRTRRWLLDAQRARGPDGEGWFEGEGFFLGIRRLAIISPTGPDGPYADQTKRVWVVMNGEIYNEPELRSELSMRHQFSTHVDSELLVHAYVEWGADFVNRLNGVFSFALVDLRVRRLLIARDRFGTRPLFWRRIRDCVLVASSARALAKIPSLGCDVSTEGLAEFLMRQSIAPPRTAFRDVHALCPGEMLSWVDQAGELRADSRRYWRLGEQPVRVRHSDGPSLGAVIGLACQRQRRSDRQRGLALSGGIDSGLLASYVGESQLSHTAYCLNTGALSEVPFARSIATAFGIQLEELMLPTDLGAAVMAWISHADHQPPCDGLNTYLLCASLPADVVTLFVGTGADELFHGYAELDAVVDRRSPSDTVSAFLRATALFPVEVVRGLVGRWGIDAGELAWSIADSVRAEIPDLEQCDSHEVLRLLLVHGYLGPRLLADSDTYSMASGVELRVPYLDNDVAEFAFAIPYSQMVGEGPSAGKLHLRELGAERGIPVDVLRRRKQGFTLPYGELVGLLPDTQHSLNLPAEHVAAPYRTWAWAVFCEWLRLETGTNLLE